MQIALDVRATDAHFPGIAREIVGLMNGLHALDTDFQIDLIANAGRPLPADRERLAGDRRFRWHTVAAGPFSVAQQWELPRLARRLAPMCWHAPYYLRPLFGLPPTVIKVADLIPERVPAASSLRARLLFRWVVRLSVRSAREIITGSQAAARDLQALHAVPADRLHVVPLAADARFAPQAEAVIATMRAHYGLPQRYVLYLGSNKPHKQPEVAVQAFATLIARSDLPPNVKLVVAGRWDRRFGAAEQAAAPIADHVLFRPNIVEADLPALLAGAEVFVFPSLYEGFGLPPLEAMACGTPVIVSNRTSLPEVVGDAGLLVEPNVVAFSGALEQLLQDKDVRDELRERGLRQAARFSWERAAEGTLAVYRKCLTSSN